MVAQINLTLTQFQKLLGKCSGIYQIKNNKNNHRYIGSSNNIFNRWKRHIVALNRKKHKNIYLQRAWNKYGKLAFEFIILEICCSEELLHREQVYLDYFNPEYNSSTIAGKVFFSKEIRNKIGIATARRIKKNGHPMLGKHHSVETRAVIRIKRALQQNVGGSKIGHIWSETSKQKLSETRKKMWKQGLIQGHPCSEEQKKKIGLANKLHMAGRKYSEDTKAKMSAAAKGNKRCLGHKHSEETKAKMRVARQRRIENG